MLPKAMARKEWCDVCFKEMELDHSLLREDKSAVEVFYKCKCGYTITFAYAGGFVEAYMKQLDSPNQPNPETTLPTESTEVQGEKR